MKKFGKDQNIKTLFWADPQQLEEWNFHPLLCSGATPPAVLPPALGSQTSGRYGAAGASLEEATKMLQKREKLCYGNRLRAGYIF